MKKINFTGKPSSSNSNVDNWVEKREIVPVERTKRLTIDVPLSLHKRIKTQCAVGELVMADVIREILEERFPATAE